jgi:hypothetical protein
MRLVRRILLTVVITASIVFIAMRWIAPVALSYYAAEKAPPIVRVVPTDLNDLTISQAPGPKLRYIGYEFEVPWTDLDESQTKLYPRDKPEKSKVDFHFQSGLRLVVSAIPAREMVDGLPKELGVSSQALEAAFGRDTMKSDYTFLKAVYEFTPERMNHWVFRQGPMNRDEFLLIIKSIVPSKGADSGIFNVRNQNYQGFQQGNPQVREDRIIVDLYSGEGGVEMIFMQKDYRNTAGVTQPEINRIVQSLRTAMQQTGSVH